MDQALQPHKLLAVNSNPFPLMLQLQAEGNEGMEGKEMYAGRSGINSWLCCAGSNESLFLSELHLLYIQPSAKAPCRCFRKSLGLMEECSEDT